MNNQEKAYLAILKLSSDEKLPTVPVVYCERCGLKLSHKITCKLKGYDSKTGKPSYTVKAILFCKNSNLFMHRYHTKVKIKLYTYANAPSRWEEI